MTLALVVLVCAAIAVVATGVARRRRRAREAGAVSRAWIAEHTETDGKSGND